MGSGGDRIKLAVKVDDIRKPHVVSSRIAAQNKTFGLEDTGRYWKILAQWLAAY